MRIVVCPSDRNAVGFYRLGLPAQTLMEQDAGIEFVFLPGLPLNVHKPTGQPVGLAKEFFDFEPDLLILQRPTTDWKALAVHWARERGIGVVVEIDDDLHSLHHAQVKQMGLRPEHLRNLGECVKHADLVTASTPALAERYAPHGRYAVLPNYVDERWLDIGVYPNIEPTFAAAPGHSMWKPVVGWTGTVATHRDDLQATRGGVAMAVQEHGARFRVIGRPDLAKQNLGLATEPEHVPWQDRDQYPHEIAKLDIGIAPLADNAFNRAKSWLKPLEYAACGVPCVMSPTAEYQRLHEQHGIGLLAQPRSRDWKRHTLRLLADSGYRNQLAEQGRQAVRDSLTIQANAWRWAECWEAAQTAKLAA